MRLSKQTRALTENWIDKGPRSICLLHDLATHFPGPEDGSHHTLVQQASSGSIRGCADASRPRAVERVGHQRSKCRSAPHEIEVAGSNSHDSSSSSPSPPSLTAHGTPRHAPGAGAPALPPLPGGGRPRPLGAPRRPVDPGGSRMGAGPRQRPLLRRRAGAGPPVRAGGPRRGGGRAAAGGGGGAAGRRGLRGRGR
jgi:hypothetical protein